MKTNSFPYFKRQLHLLAVYEAIALLSAIGVGALVGSLQRDPVIGYYAFAGFWAAASYFLVAESRAIFHGVGYFLSFLKQLCFLFTTLAALWYDGIVLALVPLMIYVVCKLGFFFTAIDLVNRKKEEGLTDI